MLILCPSARAVSENRALCRPAAESGAKRRWPNRRRLQRQLAELRRRQKHGTENTKRQNEMLIGFVGAIHGRTFEKAKLPRTRGS